MITVQELRTWASGLDLSGHVGIDEGGLTLVEVPEHDRLSGAYLEVGGCDEDPDPTDPASGLTGAGRGDGERCARGGGGVGGGSADHGRRQPHPHRTSPRA
ncbi:hypothetical protein [Nocardia abscessus]|uniref:hypothetical protein n=1 Tax=Nocardia abscessus TaxID=120957 RepID=UPI002456B986|nr:hypothetical protein [Nocardia abscessus]